MDPSKRITAKQALDNDYFWEAPYPSKPEDLPKYAQSHEFTAKKRRQDAAKQGGGAGGSKPPATKALPIRAAPWKCARKHRIEADDVLEWGGGIVGRVMGSGGVG